MKKVIFTIILIVLFVPIILAFTPSFDIDMDNININNKSNKLIEVLDKSYKIDTDDFKVVNANTDKVKEFTKNLVEVSFSDKDIEEINKEIAKHIFINPNNGIESLTSTIMLKTYIDDLSKHTITYDYIKVIRVVESSEGIFTFAYLPKAVVDDKIQDMVASYWLKEVDGEYKVYLPWFSFGDNLTDYFNTIAEKEAKGEHIGDSYKKISITGEEQKLPEEELLNSLYSANLDSNVQVTAMKENGIGVYASGFFISKGIVATTWSTFLQFLNNSDYIYVNDSKRTYNISGIVAANETYDIVVLKLAEEAGQPVKFAKSETLKTDDKLFTINSKNNNGFSINYGSFISMENGRLKNFLALSESDVGSALYNSNGEVVGFTVPDVLSSELSYANSTDYLIKLQDLLNTTGYNDIRTKDISIFKDKYYNKITKEVEYQEVDKAIWNKLTSIGSLEDTIKLPLIKASYKDKILSIRYKNEAINSLDTMYLVKDYTSNLENEGYKKTYLKYNKMIYQNRKYKIIIKEDLDYLIILIMEN